MEMTFAGSIAAGQEEYVPVSLGEPCPLKSRLRPDCFTYRSGGDFAGLAVTVKDCTSSERLLVLLARPGKGRVLVISSKNVAGALVDRRHVELAKASGWAGLVTDAAAYPVGTASDGAGLVAGGIQDVMVSGYEPGFHAVEIVMGGQVIRPGDLVEVRAEDVFVHENSPIL